VGYIIIIYYDNGAKEACKKGETEARSDKTEGVSKV
jgi:hypothetical protein